MHLLFRYQLFHILVLYPTFRSKNLTPKHFPRPLSKPFFKVEVVDDKIPKLRHHKLTHSDVIKEMIINGLGFVNQRLYLFPEFYEKLPVERLIKKGIEPSDLNDDVLGRTLDAIYEYGPTDLFNEIILKVMSQLDLGTKIIHADTTSFSVHGTYEGHDGQKAIEITLGHSKDSRMHLKQFVLRNCAQLT